MKNLKHKTLVKNLSEQCNIYFKIYEKVKNAKWYKEKNITENYLKSGNSNNLTSLDNGLINESIDKYIDIIISQYTGVEDELGLEILKNSELEIGQGDENELRASINCLAVSANLYNRFAKLNKQYLDYKLENVEEVNIDELREKIINAKSMFENETNNDNKTVKSNTIKFVINDIGGTDNIEEKYEMSEENFRSVVSSFYDLINCYDLKSKSLKYLMTELYIYNNKCKDGYIYGLDWDENKGKKIIVDLPKLGQISLHFGSEAKYVIDDSKQMIQDILQKENNNQKTVINIPKYNGKLYEFTNNFPIIYKNNKIKEIEKSLNLENKSETEIVNQLFDLKVNEREINDREVYYLALKLGLTKNVLTEINNKIKLREIKDKTDALKEVEKDANNLRFINDELKNDDDFIMSLFNDEKIRNININFLGNNIYNNKDLARKLYENISPDLKIDYSKFSDEIRGDSNFMINSLQYIGKEKLNELGNEIDNINEKIRSTKDKEEKDTLRKEKERIRCNDPISRVDYDLWENREFVLEAVKYSKRCLENASEQLANDKELVLEAIKYDLGASEFIDDSLKEDKDIIETIEKQKNKHSIDEVKDIISNRTIGSINNLTNNIKNMQNKEIDNEK